MQSLAPSLVDAGYDVVHVPLIQIELFDAAKPTAGVSSLATGELAKCVVSSGYSVEYLVSTGLDFTEVGFSCVGEATAQKVRNAGWNVELSADGSSASLASVIPASEPGPPATGSNRPDTLLMLQGSYHNQELQQALEVKGYGVTVETVYGNSPSAISATQRDDLMQADAVLLASRSAVQSLISRLGVKAKVVKCVVAGETTKVEALEHGLNIIGESSRVDDRIVSALASGL